MLHWPYSFKVIEHLKSRASPAPFEKIGYNKFAFEVTDIKSDYKRLVEAGVQFLSDPVQSKDATEVYGRDPDGNLFSLFEPAPGSSPTRS